MRWIISSSVKFRLLAVALGAAMMFFGVRQLRDMPVDAFPEFAPRASRSRRSAWDLNAAEVEELVTRSARASAERHRRLDLMRSKSVPQLSSIEIQFDQGTDILEARQLVRSASTSVTPSLPTWAAPPFMHAAVSTTGRVVKIGVSSKTMSIQRPVDDRLLEDPSPAVAGPGVANVAIWGERLEQYTYSSTRQRMRDSGVTLDHVMERHGRCAGRRPPAVLERCDHRHRRVHRHPEPATADPARAPDRDA